MKRKMPRLKKNPEAADYVCEVIDRTTTKDLRTYRYFMQRADAREFAKLKASEGLRVRVFRIKYTLVSDSK